MKQLFTCTLFLILLIPVTLQAQNPFSEYGVKTEVLTLTDGKYNEYFDEDTIVQIGTVLFNTNTNKIVAFIQQDTAYTESALKPEITSRWLSRDPYAAKYPFLSPYTFALDNPVIFMDPDGRDVEYAGSKQKELQATIFTLVTESKIMEHFYLMMVGSPETYVIGRETYDTKGLVMFYQPVRSSLIARLLTARTFDHEIRYNILHQTNIYDDKAGFKNALSEEIIHAGQFDFERRTGYDYSNLQKEVEARVFRAYLGHYSSTSTTFADGMIAEKEGGVTDFANNVNVQNYFQAAKSGDQDCMNEYEPGFRDAVGEMAKNITDAGYYGDANFAKDNSGSYGKLQKELKDMNAKGNETPLFDEHTKKKE